MVDSMECPRGPCDGIAEQIGEDNYVCIECSWTGSKSQAETIRDNAW